MEHCKLWKLTVVQQTECDRRWKSLSGHAGFIRSSITPFGRTGTMKIHDWHVFMSTDVGKYCLQGLLPLDYYSIFCSVVDILKHLLATEINVSRLHDFYPELIMTLCRVEKFVPSTNHLMVFHLCIEVYQSVCDLGPTYYYWMYMFGTYDAS